MNDSLLSAAIGFGGSLVGALFALLGTWLTLWHTRKEAHNERREQRQEADLALLRDAYVEWLEAADRAAVRIGEMFAELGQGNHEAARKMLASLREDHVFLAEKLQLLDPDKGSTMIVMKFVKSFLTDYERLANMDRVMAPSEQGRFSEALGAELRRIRFTIHERLKLSLPNTPTPTRALAKED